jgi:hypothetical protein
MSITATTETLNPISHANDPATSREAAERITQSGARGAHCRMVLAMVAMDPNLTAGELWQRAAPSEQGVLKELQEVRRRLTDLLAAGKVSQGLPRPCAIRGAKAVVWTGINE